MSNEDLVQKEKVVETEDFLDNLKRRINADFEAGERFMKDYHAKMKVWWAAYHSSERYTDLRSQNKVPVTWIQEDVDTFKADARDKLFYTGRPCRIVGREEDDKVDAEAKQEFMDYIDSQDRIFNKFGLFLRDCGLYSTCAGNVSYEERTKREWNLRPVPVARLDEITGEEIIGEDGEVEMAVDPQTGEPLQQTDKEGRPVEEWMLEEIVIFRGSKVKRIDMQNIFITIDKESNEDFEPIMVQSWEDREFFNSQTYFINKEELDIRAQATTGGNQDKAKEKKGSPNESNKPYQYIEWQGWVDKEALYKLQKSDPDLKIVDREKRETIDREMAKIAPGERTLVVVGLTDGEVFNRISEDPLKWGKPSIILGVIDPEEDTPLGRGIAQMTESYQSIGETLHDILMENFKQSVNAMWYINTAVLAGRKELVVNRAGEIIEGTVDASKAIQRIEQPKIATDIYLNIDRSRDAARRAGGVMAILTGQGDPNAQTLGENQIALNQSNLRMRDYIRSFEVFVEELYELRNHIHATFIDKDFAFKIVGKKADEWRTITPVQQRASVDFVCESSTRETNRAVITQQIIQFVEIGPLAANAGQPVRFDKMMYDLGELGFNMSREKLEGYFPLIKAERENPDKNFISNLMIQNALAMMMGGAVGTQTNGAGGGGPQPLTDGEALQGANARNQPNPGRVN